MKIISVCKHGNNRSTCLTMLLKRRGHDAVAFGYEKNGDELKKLLYNWADKIIVVEKKFLDEKYKDKTLVWDIGEDIWGLKWHPDLEKNLKDKLDNCSEIK